MKRKMMEKKFFTPLIALAVSMATVFACFGTTACKKDPPPEPQPLSAPVITLTDNVISWNAVPNATGYTIKEGDTAVSENQQQTSYTITKTEAGSYTYTVTALSTDKNYTASPASNAVTYEVKPDKLAEAAVPLTNSTVYIVGDSTVDSTFKDIYYMPRVGYGGAIQDYLELGANAKVENLAVSGRSSYSYMFESKANYEKIVNNIKEGDFLIIGFGHNDQKTDVGKFGDPNLPYNDTTTLLGGRPVSFKYTLYNHYIKVAQDAGATPVLCTPIVRLKENNNYESEHITTASNVGGVDYAGGNYPQAIRDLGEELGVTVIDLTELTKADYTANGYTEAANYHAWTKGSIASVDKTHTNLYGARMNAYHFAKALKQSDNALGKAVKANPAAPDKTKGIEDSVAMGLANGYVVKEYTAPTNTSTIWTTIQKEGWKGTVFGDVGGQDKINATNFTVKQTGDTFTIGNHSDTIRGKISGTTDGIAAVYMRLDKLRNFKIETTVKIDKFTKGTNNQHGFGLMLRDDMYVDTNDKTISSNYISAGWYGLESGNAIYMRKNSGLVNSGKTGTCAVGDTHTLSIEKNDQTFTVKYDSYTEQAMFTDLSLVGIDNDYIYICLYATRGIVATFSNIVYTDNGMGTDA